MSVPLIQRIRVGAYILKQKLQGRQRYPLVLMLEPLFRCNLACAGCGKIDYPKAILARQMSVEDCLAAVDECGAPVVSIPGGEPLLHPKIGDIVAGITSRKKFVYLCTNALLLEKKLERFRPSPYLTLSIHLDGLREEHDRSVDQAGVYDRAERAIRRAVALGFRVTVNCTLFNDAKPDRVAAFFDHVGTLGVEGITVSPGYAYERAPDQAHFLTRQETKRLFRDIFRRGKGRGWRFSQSTLFLDFLAGNQDYRCTPWGNPTRNIFGWQRPCYLLGEGYAKSFRELMETTDWDAYGTGRYEKCADCMVHCGFEPTAVADTVAHPLKAWRVFRRGVETEAPMQPEIDLSSQRPAEQVFDANVAAFEQRLDEASGEQQRDHAAQGRSRPAGVTGEGNEGAELTGPTAKRGHKPKQADTTVRAEGRECGRWYGVIRLVGHHPGDDADDPGGVRGGSDGVALDVHGDRPAAAGQFRLGRRSAHRHVDAHQPAGAKHEAGRTEKGCQVERLTPLAQHCLGDHQIAGTERRVERTAKAEADHGLDPALRQCRGQPSGGSGIVAGGACLYVTTAGVTRGPLDQSPLERQSGDETGGTHMPQGTSHRPLCFTVR